MPKYHGREFSVTQLSKLLGKPTTRIKELVKEAEDKRLSLERYMTLYESTQQKHQAVSGKIWVNCKGTCKKCNKSYTKTGRWNMFCPVCNKDKHYRSEIHEYFDKVGALDKKE